uniref:Secreted protein n=1 Tax=Syphacia muris TaxID=451379 RepID=A0A0N5B0Q9_9BILA
MCGLPLMAAAFAATAGMERGREAGANAHRPRGTYIFWHKPFSWINLILSSTPYAFLASPFAASLLLWTK